MIWLKGRSILRAFEVEHTTSIYSGILRMADLLALQPNMEIQLHIVAPVARREKVLQEIRRPVFSLLDGKPLSERCTYLSYEHVREIAALQHLDHLSETVVDEYAERCRVTMARSVQDTSRSLADRHESRLLRGLDGLRSYVTPSANCLTEAADWLA